MRIIVDHDARLVTILGGVQDEYKGAIEQHRRNGYRIVSFVPGDAPFASTAMAIIRNHL